MRWERVRVEAIGTVLPELRVSSRALEDRLASVYAGLNLAPGQLETLTGIVERRWWPEGGADLSGAAAEAGRRALGAAGMDARELGVVIYAGVSRENLEPATACPVADALGVRGRARVLDVSNACLGVLDGVTIVADLIELGRVRAGLVVAAESAREIAQDTIARLHAQPDLPTLTICLASLTGGSGAVGVLLVDARDSIDGHRLRGAVSYAAPEHHRIARWGPAEGLLGRAPWVMETNATAVLHHGVRLGAQTWDEFLPVLGWDDRGIDKAIIHQVGASHRDKVLPALGLRPEQDFSTFATLGNIGPVSVPLTCAHATEQGFLRPGDRVGWLGIGTGLNCMMLGWDG